MPARDNLPSHPTPLAVPLSTLDPRARSSQFLKPAHPLSTPPPPIALPPSIAPWLHRTALAALLLLAYLYAWTPARTLWTEHLAAPVCDAVSHSETVVTPRPSAHTVRLQPATGSGFTYQAPAGVKFLLPGLFLVLLVPARPRLGLFLGGHLALGGLALILASGGTTGLPGGFMLAQFVQDYGVDAYSLAVPVLAFARVRSGGRL